MHGFGQDTAFWELARPLIMVSLISERAFAQMNEMGSKNKVQNSTFKFFMFCFLIKYI